MADAENDRVRLREPMQAVRRNAERIVEFLRGTEYVLEPWALTDPDPAGLRRLDALYRLPASLFAFWEVVGGVNLMTRTSCLETEALKEGDPLVIHEVQFVLPLAESAREHGTETFRCPISPDLVTKGGAGGGPGWHVELPSLDRDVRLRTAPDEPMFLDYLAHSLGHGGFASIDPDLELEPPEMLDELIVSLEPITFAR